MSTPRDDLLRQSAAMERVQELAHAHGFDADADAQQAVYDALLAYAGEERDALASALVDEYAAALAARGRYAERGDEPWIPVYRRAAMEALWRVAAQIGLDTLHAQAADVVARGEREDADGDV